MRHTNRPMVVLALAAMMSTLLGNVAFGDAVNDTNIHVVGTEASNSYTNTRSVQIHTHPEHCPDGGNMDAIELSFRNSTSDPWTVVKAGGTPWPTGDCTGSTKPAATNFAWTLATGSDGTRTVYARFKHGNTETASSDTIILDTVAPAITDAGPTAAPTGSNSWYTVAVTNQFTATDTGGSGLADTTKASFSVSSGTSEGSAITIPSGTVTDIAGNIAASINSAAFKIDLGNPSVAITSHNNGDSVSTSSITVAETATDGISGIAGVTVNGFAATVGTGTFQRWIDLDCGANNVSATATDAAGRQTSTTAISVTRTCGSVTYSAAFAQPLDMGGVLNKAKVGRVVPVKVEVLGSDSSEDKTSVISLSNRAIDCASGSGSDTVETYSAGSANTGLDFRWDATGDFWIYNLDTSKLPNAAANKCYQLEILRNGAAITGTVKIQLTK